MTEAARPTAQIVAPYPAYPAMKVPIAATAQITTAAVHEACPRDMGGMLLHLVGHEH